MVIKKNNPQKKKSLGSSVPSETDKTSKKQGNSGKKTEVIVPTQQPSVGFPIVGIGASAGRLAAFEAFFSDMPIKVDTSMAFVLVQHLTPDRKRILIGILQRLHFRRSSVAHPPLHPRRHRSESGWPHSRLESGGG